MGKTKYSESASPNEKKSFAKYLSEDEELVLATGFGKTYLRHRFFYYIIFPGGIAFLIPLGIAYFLKVENFGIPLLIGLIGAAIVAYLKTLYVYHANRYLLTTRRVIIKKGLLAVNLTSALYDKITHLEVDQGLYDRLVMHHGNISINTAGGSGDQLKLKYVDYPIEFKNLLERLINREREHYGKATGPVVTLEGELVD